eukprot:7677337-Alexandrium_andersonii.AAC.1
MCIRDSLFLLLLLLLLLRSQGLSLAEHPLDRPATCVEGGREDGDRRKQPGGGPRRPSPGNPLSAGCRGCLGRGLSGRHPGGLTGPPGPRGWPPRRSSGCGPAEGAR